MALCLTSPGEISPVQWVGWLPPHLGGKYCILQMLRASLDRILVCLVGLGVTLAPLQSGCEADRSTNLRMCWPVSMYGECQKFPGGYALWKWFLKDRFF